MKIMTNLYIALAAVLLLSSNALAAPMDYPILCKGGGDMKVYFSTVGGSAAMTIIIKKSQYAGGSGKVGSGECAWLDRPFNASEASEFVIGVKNWSYSSFAVDADSKVISNLGLGGSNGNKVTDLFNFITTQGREFYLRGYSIDNNRRIMITKIGL